MKTRLTLAEARAIMADDSQPEILRAAANTIVSLTAACEALQQAFDEQEKLLNYNREALR